MLAEVLQKRTRLQHATASRPDRGSRISDCHGFEDSIKQAEDDAKRHRHCQPSGRCHQRSDAVPTSPLSTFNLQTARPVLKSAAGLSESGVVVIFMTANPEVVVNLGVGAGVISKPVPQDAVEQCLAYAIAKRAGTHARDPDRHDALRVDHGYKRG